jgi:hypothetical protein
LRARSKHNSKMAHTEMSYVEVCGSGSYSVSGFLPCSSATKVLAIRDTSNGILLKLCYQHKVKFEFVYEVISGFVSLKLRK